LAMHGAGVNVMRLLSTIMESRLFGGSIFLLLLGLGFVSPTSDTNTLARRGFLFAAAIASIVPLFSLHAFHDRFVFPFLTLLLPFAAGGLVFFYRSLLSTLASGARLPALLSNALAGTVTALVLIGYLGTQAHTMLHLETDARLPEQDITVQRGDVFVKSLGKTIQNYGVKNPLVMDGTPAIGYYAGAADWPFPYCDSETALRYIEKKAPHFVVLQSSKEDVFPYLKEWIEKGIPDQRIELIYQATAPNGEVGQIYRRR